MNERKRFNVLKCGRRFGKTDLTKELTINPMLDGQYVGYWTPTYKDLADVWTELVFSLRDVIAHKDVQMKQIILITGGKLDMWSLEDPNSGRGRKYHRAIIDEAEKARHLKDGWEQTIRATLVDYSGDAWFMSTPKFGDTYFKSTLYKNQERFDDWKSWRFSSYDNPYLPKEEVEAARAQLDDLVFRCEYLAEDVDIVGNPWAWAFERDKHVAKDLDNPIWRGDQNNYLYLSFDFNRNPITCGVIQHLNGCIYVIEQIKLANSNIYDLCDRIAIKYPNFVYIVTGDATGQASSALVKDNLNYYKVIKQKLRLNDTQFKLPSINPKLEENQVLVNSILTHYPVQMHPTQAEGLIYDMQNVATNADGSLVKGDREDPKQQADALDTFRYYVNMFHRHHLKKPLT